MARTATAETANTTTGIVRRAIEGVDAKKHGKNDASGESAKSANDAAGAAVGKGDDAAAVAGSDGGVCPVVPEAKAKTKERALRVCKWGVKCVRRFCKYDHPDGRAGPARRGEKRAAGAEGATGSRAARFVVDAVDPAATGAAAAIGMPHLFGRFGIDASLISSGERVATAAQRSSIALSCHVTPIALRHASLIVPTAIPIPTSTGAPAALSTTTPTSISRKMATALPALVCATPRTTRR